MIIIDGWRMDREERVRFWRDVKDQDRRVTLANGAGVRVSSVSVHFRRAPGEPWGEPSVSVSHGAGWDLTVTRCPAGLRGGQMPAWLAALVAEVEL